MALARPPLMPHIVKQRTADGPMAELLALAREAERERGVPPDLRGGRLRLRGRAREWEWGSWRSRTATPTWLRTWRSARRRGLGAARGVHRGPPGFRGCGPGRAGLGRERGPVVLADLADNVGGGTPGDGTALLEELLRQGPEGALVLIADPEAVARCLAAGVRERVRLEVGGKADDLHGRPVPVEGTVRLLAERNLRNAGPMRDGLVDDMGRTAVLDVQGLTLVLTERKLPMWNLQQVRSLGIEPSRHRIIVCKGAVAHRAAYAPIASRLIEVETPGACAGDVRRFGTGTSGGPCIRWMSGRR